MPKLLGSIGSIAGSSAGWWLGAHMGVMTGVLLAAFGTGVGLYAGRRLADWLIE